MIHYLSLLVVWISAVIINGSNNRRLKKILIFIFLMVLVSIGCNKTTVQDADLLKTKWTLSSIQDTKTGALTNYPSSEKTKISIVFTDSLNILSFYGICNDGWGIYSYIPSYTSSTSSSGAIKITDLVTTINYCINCEYCSEWEGYTTQNLDSTFSYKINGNNLVIYSTGTYNLNFSQN